MTLHQNNHIKYLTLNKTDENWGMIVTTVGYQDVARKETYPPSEHPSTHIFSPEKGRILREYQLVYIISGKGYFCSESVPLTEISEGTMILLFPGEWHSYYPDKETGWSEYWVGFKGTNMDMRVENGFFSKKEPLHRILVSSTIVSLYDNIIQFATLEKSGYQQIISGILLHILGLTYYKERNNSFTDTYTVDKINKARIIIKNHLSNEGVTPINPEQIATELGLGYTWFRRKFKEYTGVSPTQYMLQIKYIRAKEMLSTSETPISEIAFSLGFETIGQFSTFFKKKEGTSPKQFRENIHNAFRKSSDSK